MADFDLIFSDEEREKKEKKAKVTPLVCGNVTEEEYEQAMEEFYNEIFNGFWRKK